MTHQLLLSLGMDFVKEQEPGDFLKASGVAFLEVHFPLLGSRPFGKAKRNSTIYFFCVKLLVPLNPLGSQG